VNTIHNTSLAASTAAVNKQQPATVVNHKPQTVNANNGNADTQQDKQNARPSSTDQIDAALTKAGLTYKDYYDPSNNSQTRKALNTYIQNRNQAARHQVAQTLSGIDLYA